MAKLVSGLVTRQQISSPHSHVLKKGPFDLYYYVFEFLICFVRVIIAWPGDRPIFQEEDEDMVDPVDYFIEGD